MCERPESTRSSRKRASDPGAPLRLRTRRLVLIAADETLAAAERFARARFARLLGAEVPDAWPPASMIDALPVFHLLVQKRPHLRGWLVWYAPVQDGVARPGTRPVLVGSGGFKGAPDAAGMVETGYCVLPAYRGRGLATEMVGALLAWAFTHRAVARVEAETAVENRASRRVLEKCGFAERGPSLEGGLRFVSVRGARTQH